MPADGGINFEIFFGEPDRAFAAFEAGADGNHLGNPGGLGTGDDLGQIRRIVGIIQMGVGVEENGHGNLRMGDCIGVGDRRHERQSSLFEDRIFFPDNPGLRRAVSDNFQSPRRRVPVPEVFRRESVADECVVPARDSSSRRFDTIKSPKTVCPAQSKGRRVFRSIRHYWWPHRDSQSCCRSPPRACHARAPHCRAAVRTIPAVDFFDVSIPHAASAAIFRMAGKVDRRRLSSARIKRAARHKRPRRT